MAYFVYSFLLPTLSVLLAASQALVPRTCSPGSTSSYARGTLIDGTVTAQQWAHLGVTGSDLAGHPAGGRPRPS